MKIVNLEAGPLLDYWVNMAAGSAPVYQADSAEGARAHRQVPQLSGRAGAGAAAGVSAVHQLSDGGPFIEREHIDLVSDFGRWMAPHEKRDDYSRANVSPLVAAMRADLMREYGMRCRGHGRGVHLRKHSRSIRTGLP